MGSENDYPNEFLLSEHVNIILGQVLNKYYTVLYRSKDFKIIAVLLGPWTIERLQSYIEQVKMLYKI